MQLNGFLEDVIGITTPWRIVSAEFDGVDTVDIELEFVKSRRPEAPGCPECGSQETSYYDMVEMSGAYRKGADIDFPDAKITFDGSHVAELAAEAVDDTRKREYAAMMDREDEERRRSLRGQRHLFLKNYRNLDDEGQSRLRGLLSMFPDLGRVYVFKESLRAVWEMESKYDARMYLLR